MMQIVYEWRRFYTSVVKNKTTGKKYNLKQACEQVNIFAKMKHNIEVPKKTLDHHFKLVL